MKRITILLMLALGMLASLALAASAAPSSASRQTTLATGHMTDSDGDGTPDCLDPDYVPPQDGTGRKLGRSAAQPSLTQNLFQYLWKWQFRFLGPLTIVRVPGSAASGYGPGDGTGNGGVGPQDGTGYGPGPNGTGDCDGSGPEILRTRLGR